MYPKNSEGFTLVSFAYWSSRWIEKRFATKSISGTFPCSREPTIFPFSRSNQRSGCLRHSTFGFYILSAMTARSPGAIVGDFVNPIERPFFLSLHPKPHRDVSTPSAPPAFSFLSTTMPFLFNRYYAVPAPDRENREIQSDPTIRKIFLLVAFVLPPHQTSPSSPPLRISPAIIFTHLHAEDNKG